LPVAAQENAAGAFEAGKVPAHRWLTHIVNAFGASGCFRSLLQVRTRAASANPGGAPGRDTQR
jgi:hypothetical protein